MAYDFNSSRSTRNAFNEAMNAIVDAGIDAAGAKEQPRNYLGASQIGDECARRVQYEITHAPGEPFLARIRRIFQRGHVGEDMVASWLRLAGFELSTLKPDGDQYGFMRAGGKFGGHCDGILTGGNDILTYPALWENKVLGSKGYKAALKDGIAKAHPKYAAQVSLYQAYLDLADNPALVSVTNADTMEIYYEPIEFDAVRAQEASDRAVHILRATAANELLPRVSNTPEGWPCGYCQRARHCWGENPTLGPHRPGDPLPQTEVAPPATPEPARSPPRPTWLLSFALKGRASHEKAA